jgi:hypothetical protein
MVLLLLHKTNEEEHAGRGGTRDTHHAGSELHLKKSSTPPDTLGERSMNPQVTLCHHRYMTVDAQ